MSKQETWFEALLDIDLALLLNRIAKVHERLGKARQKELRERIAAAIPGPSEPPSREPVLGHVPVPSPAAVSRGEGAG